jgi:hypothetical protein
MPTQDEWRDEIDDVLFGTGATDPVPKERRAESLEFPQPREAALAQPRAVPIDDLDAALFGRDAPSASTRTHPQDLLAAPDITRPAEDEVTPPEPEMFPEPALTPMIVDEDDPDLPAEPIGGAPRSRKHARGRRRAWAAGVVVALVVIVGGALALNRSDGARPGVRTGSPGTSTTTTAVTTTTTPAPQTAAPAEAPPTAAPPTKRAAPTTPSRSVAPRPPPTEPPPPEAAPPPPDSTPPPESTPPSTELLLPGP